MKRTALGFLVSALLVLVGITALRGTVSAENDDPIASVHNGAPRGLLAIAVLLEQHEVPLTVRRTFEDPEPIDGALWVVPPPERTSWTEQDARALLAWVEGGGRALVLCDEDAARRERLRPLLDAVGVVCDRVDVAIGDVAFTDARGTMPGFARGLVVRGSGRVRAKGPTSVVPAWRVGNDEVVVKRQVGDGMVTVLGSATVLANDGLALGENAAFLLDELARSAASHLVVDERHHRMRVHGVWANAFARGAGPRTGALALLLLVPLSLLALSPRPGDAPPADDEGAGAPAAAAQARALAALLARAGR
ncbi:MAG: DUF4350 domain-containing protein [Deltaproteobacteria bacterium]|nr:DUF4350 domain-containing protein [Deltaproteobacteria bacterium]